MRLHTAIISITLLVTTILTVFLTYYLVDIERQDALADLESTITRNNDLLKLVNRSPLYNLDKNSLEVNLDSFFTDENMINIELIEYDGDIHIFRSRKPRSDNAELISSKVVIVRGDIELGEVRSTYSTDLIEEYLVVKRNKHLFFSSVLLGAFSFIIYLVIKHFTAPIGRLTTAAKQIADGDLDREIETSGAYELATLGKSFSSMRDAIKEKISDLATQNIALEQEVKARIQTEAALKSSEKKFTSLFMATPVITTLTTIEDDVFLDVNDAFHKVTGYFREDIIGKKGRDIDFIIDDQSHQNLKNQLALSGTVQHQELQILTKDFRTLDVIWFIEKIQVGDQNLLLNVLMDVTIRKKTEAEIIYLRNLLRNTFNSMPSILVGVDFDGKITQWNQHASEITAIEEEKAIGQRFSSILPYSIELSKIQQSINDKKTYKLSKHLSKNDQITDITIYPLIEGDVKEAVIRIDDVTERVRIEEMMVQSEKMLSVGGLAAGMAHEINNPLAGIMQNIQVVANRTKPDLKKNLRVAEECGLRMEDICSYMEKREIFSMIDSIMSSSMRAAKIVENMLDFSRKSTSEYTLIDLSQLLDQTIELAANDYDLKKNFDFKHIQLIRNYSENLPEVLCDKSKIQQVFLNLLTNGAQAMESGTINNEPPSFTLSLQSAEDSVVISIEDNGPGMDQPTAKRVFEPFFTTKGVGKGTGLGLSVSYFIITEDHHGEMEVLSTPNQGAKFTITLPVKAEM